MPNMPMHWLRGFNTVGSLLPIGLFVLLPTEGQAKMVKTATSDLPQTSEESLLTFNSVSSLEAQTWTVETLTLATDSPEQAEPERHEIETESTSTSPIEPTATELIGAESADSTGTSINTSTDGEATTDSTNPESTEEPADDESASEETDETEPTELEPTADAEAELTPEEQQRRELLIQADALYLAGNIEAAEKLYRQAKDPLWKGQDQALQQPLALYDPTAIAPAAQVYWQEAMMGIESGLETRTLVPLQLLVEQYPEFIPGHVQLAETLQQYEQTEEALTVLNQAVAIYPNEPSLIRAHAQALAEQEQWMEASISARQFALMNQAAPEAKKFRWLADEYLDEFKSEARSNQWGSAIANVITGTISAVVTGNIFAPISGVSSTVALLQGEEQIGEQVANQARRQLPLVRDPEIVAYVDDIGQRLAEVAGRDEFEYEFEVVLDDQLNAFALPGGKIFVNAGAIAETQSEAELAGLLAHELAHAVLSHGFQMVTEGNLTASLAQYLPFGGTIADLLIMGYSRDMERQADVLGTQILASADYAADGLHNLMVTLEEQEEDSPVFSWLSTHPLTDDRVEYTAEVVEERNFNRYQYEGIARHSQIQAQVKDLLAKYERKLEAIEQRQR